MRMSRPLVSLALLAAALLMPPPPTVAEPSATPSMADAEALIDAGQWGEAARAFATIVESEPENGQAWSRLGAALIGQGSYAQASAALEKADALGFEPASTRFELGRAYAAQGNKPRALDWLERALEAGFDDVEALRGASELQGLRLEDRFTQLLERADRNARPCMHAPEFRQFDFWIGEWLVYTADGEVAGRNSIVEQLDGCLLREHWTGASGSEGRSINYFDPATRTWRQIWVDRRGGSIALEGRFVAPSMSLEGVHVYPDGRRESIRGVWTPLEDGRVRQYLEQSRDDGRSWYTWFDGYYERVREP